LRKDSGIRRVQGRRISQKLLIAWFVFFIRHVFVTKR
jgi:hypothetical protein